MKEQFTKLVARLKTLDKKVWIIAGAVAVALAALAIILAVALGGTDAPSGDNTAATTTTAAATTTTKATTTTTTTTTTAVKTTTTTTTTTAVITTTEPMTQAPTEAPTQAPTEAPTQAPTEAPTQAPTEAPTQAPTEAPTQATNSNGSEILGLGSESDPYLETPSDTMTVKTVSIPAGRALYYSIYRVGGMILTINDANAYVVCDGVRYDANGGSVTFTVPSALASDAVSFQIGNNGSSDAAFTLSFSNPKGSYMDPVVVSNVTARNSISLAKDADAGYYYKYYAEKSGKIRLYMTASVDSVMLATNNRNSAQRTTEADGQSDANGTYIELEVQAGDEILINVGAKPNKRGKYPAADITWYGQYV